MSTGRVLVTLTEYDARRLLAHLVPWETAGPVPASIVLELRCALAECACGEPKESS